MRIHTDIITRGGIPGAGVAAGLYPHNLDVSEHGSRTHARAFEVHLTGTSHRRPNNRGTSDDYAATWDEWGMFLADLYRLDPGMMCGNAKHPTYCDADDFDYQTAGRFDTLTPADQHRDHGFRYAGVSCEQACGCGAVRRWSF